MPSNPALAVVNEPAPTRREWLGLGVLAVGLGLIGLAGTIVGGNFGAPPNPPASASSHLPSALLCYLLHGRGA